MCDDIRIDEGIAKEIIRKNHIAKDSTAKPNKLTVGNITQDKLVF